MSQFGIDLPIRRQLIFTAQSRAPREACGFAFGFSNGEAIQFYSAREVLNQAMDPTKEFKIHDADFAQALSIAQRCKLVLAIWHSHPIGLPIPSPPDGQLLLTLQEIPFIIVGVETPLICVYESIPDDAGRYREAYRVMV